MLGYMTQDEAKKNGFTHHGKYYGIPLWVADPEGEFIIATKWAPLEWLLTPFHYIEAIVASVVLPDDEPCFRFWIGEKI